MLKITRTARHKRHLGGKDTIIIADGLIKIVIDKVQGSQVHVSIEAPRDIRIMRGELLPSAPIHTPLHASPSAQKVNDVY